MKYQIPLIAVAVFSISILLGQIYVNNAYAVTVTTFNVGTGHVDTTTFTECNYLSTTEVWCATDGGIKIINPTTQVVSSTLNSERSYEEVKCDGSFCFAWDKVSTSVGNLTKYNRVTHQLVQFYAFLLNSGGIVANGIGLAVGAGINDTIIFVGTEGQTCIQGVTPLGATDAKGVCILTGGGSGIGTLDGAKFIADGSTNDVDFVIDSDWNGEVPTLGCPDCARIVVKHQDAAGNHQYYLLNLGDTDTTFATTQECVTGTVAMTNQAHLRIIGDYMYDTPSGQDLYSMLTTGSSPPCTVFTKSNLVDENIIFGIEYDSNDNLFVIGASSSNTGVVTSSVYTFNGTNFAGTTTFDKELKVNVTTSVSGDNIHDIWIHSSEGEIQGYQGSHAFVITDLLTPSGGGGQTTICYVVQGTNQTFCKTYDLDENGNVIIDSVIGGVNPRNITTTSGELFCSLGITDCSNPDIKTNGTGMFMLLILLLVSYALVVYIHHIGKQSILGIHPMLVLLIGMVDISIAFFLGWIPDYVFYSVIVLLIGLGGFGLYKIIRGG